jgi:hypothetical protein
MSIFLWVLFLCLPISIHLNFLVFPIPFSHYLIFTIGPSAVCLSLFTVFNIANSWGSRWMMKTQIKKKIGTSIGMGKHL